MGSYTPSIVANTTSIMDFKENSNSNNWISFINAVFASIAVLPVFLVWFLGIITDSIEEKENQDERVIIIDEKDNEEVEEESKVDTEERHLYVIPNLRNNTNLLAYQDYCTYQDLDTKKPSENIRIKPQQGEPQQKKANMDIVKQRTDEEKETSNSVCQHFNWPAHDNVIEHLRSFQNQNSTISDEMRSKLSDIGILRQNVDSDSQSRFAQVKIVEQARLSGKTCKKKQVHLFWDNFQSKSRPGLDSSHDQSPSPMSRKPLKKVNLEKVKKWEKRLNNKNNSTLLINTLC